MEEERDRERWREGSREGERERWRERKKDRETERERKREKERDNRESKREREMERGIEGKRERKREREREIKRENLQCIEERHYETASPHKDLTSPIVPSYVNEVSFRHCPGNEAIACQRTSYSSWCVMQQDPVIRILLTFY
jgi:hypothetical protein